MRHIPRILIGAPAGGSGKSMITCGILQALVSRGMRAALFKCGPDHIDPAFYSRVIGVRSGNLDTFFTGDEVTRYLLEENSADADIVVLEGAAGYYDGVGGTTTIASAYELASVTRTPAVLVADCRGMSISMAAQIKGFLEYRKESRICGVILNQLPPMFYQRMKNLIEDELHIRVLGYVPVVEDCVVEDRRLGLAPPEEIRELRRKIQNLAGVLEKTLNLDALIRLAKEAENLEPVELGEIDRDYLFRTEEPVRIGLASDEAFCFFYEDNLRLLKEMGAEIVPFSPLHDKELPRGLSGLLLCDGYPERYGRELAANQSMKKNIYRKITEGMPCMAECGGFLYLHDEMEDMSGKSSQMTGIIPGSAYRTPRPARFGYVTLTLGDEVFGEDVGNLPAYEFHCFDSTNCGDGFLAKKPVSSQSWNCMHNRPNLFAGFPNIHYYGNPRLPAAFLRACEDYRNKKRKG